jgi:hypothetical protein
MGNRKFNDSNNHIFQSAHPAIGLVVDNFCKNGAANKAASFYFGA